MSTARGVRARLVAVAVAALTGLSAGILAIGRRRAALPDLDARSADEIPGYDEHGLPR